MRKNTKMNLDTFYAALSDIKLIIFDIDGVLTDGKLQYTAEGEYLKTFHVHDGLAFALLHRANIITAIITGRRSPIIDKRIKELKIPYCYQGAKHKQIAFEQLLETVKIPCSQIAYMGDDLPDLIIMDQVKLSISVPNAVTCVKQTANWITETKGGDGAVREVAEHLLKAQGKLANIEASYRFKNTAIDEKD